LAGFDWLNIDFLGAQRGLSPTVYQDFYKDYAKTIPPIAVPIICRLAHPDRGKHRNPMATAANCDGCSVE
jgi:hypothetical protein